MQIHIELRNFNHKTKEIHNIEYNVLDFFYQFYHTKFAMNFNHVRNSFSALKLPFTM